MSRARVWSIVLAMSVVLLLMVWTGRGILRQPRTHSTAAPVATDPRAHVQHDAGPSESAPGKPRAESGPGTLPTDEAPSHSPAADATESAAWIEPGVLVKALWADDHTPASNVAISAALPGDPPLSRNDARRRRQLRRSLGLPTTDAPRTRKRSARTDQHGEAWFASLRPGTWQLTTEHGSQQSVHVITGEQHELVMVLPPLDEIRGIVVDEQGNPIAGAKLWISGNTTGIFGSARARADDGGRFRIAHAPHGHWIGARRRDQFCFSNLLRIDEHHDREDSLRLVVPDATVDRALYVTTIHGATASDVRVLVWVLRDASEEATHFAGALAMPPPPTHVRSRYDGWVLIPDTPQKATLRVAILAAEHPPRVVDLGPEKFRSALPPERARRRMRERDVESVLTATVKLRRSLEVRGRTLGPADQPTGGVRVRMLQRDWLLDLGDALETTSNDAGGYALSFLPIERGQLLLATGTQEQGSALAVIGSTSFPERDEIPARRGVHEWNPLLDGLPRIQLRLTDKNGEALARWRVRLSANDGGDRSKAPLLATNARGAVIFPGPTTRRAHMEVYPPGVHVDYAPVTSEWIDAEDGHQGEREFTIRTKR